MCSRPAAPLRRQQFFRRAGSRWRVCLLLFSHNAARHMSTPRTTVSSSRTHFRITRSQLTSTDFLSFAIPNSPKRYFATVASRVMFSHSSRFTAESAHPQTRSAGPCSEPVSHDSAVCRSKPTQNDPSSFEIVVTAAPSVSSRRIRISNNRAVDREPEREFRYQCQYRHRPDTKRLGKLVFKMLSDFGIPSIKTRAISG